jgi:hypothetical protein
MPRLERYFSYGNASAGVEIDGRPILDRPPRAAQQGVDFLASEFFRCHRQLLSLKLA